MNKKITVIPARKRAQDSLVSDLKTRKRKVAAYARVSTDMDEQLNSYEAQISYYTKHIQENPKWEFVKVYTDEGMYCKDFSKKRIAFWAFSKKQNNKT